MSMFLYFTLSYYRFCISIIRSRSTILWSKIFIKYFKYMLPCINLLILFLLVNMYLFFLYKVTWSSSSPKLITSYLTPYLHSLLCFWSKWGDYLPISLN